MKQELENQRQKHQAEERQKQLTDIKDELYSLFAMQTNQSQKRGKLLEGILNRLFEVSDILLRKTFKLVSDEDEEILVSGVAEIDGYLYLVETKWWRKPLGKAEVLPHIENIYSVDNSARGILISTLGFTPPAIAACKEALTQKTTVLCELKEIVTLLEWQKSGLKDFLKKKINVAVTKKEPLFKPSQKSINNKLQERRHLQRFVEIYPDIPMSKRVFKDSPDLRILTTRGIIGIEHTQILNKKDADLKAEEESEEQVVNKAQEIFEQKNSAPIYVHASFRLGARITKSQVNNIAYSLAKLVLNNMPEKGKQKSIESWQTRNELPSEIYNVYLEWYEKATYPLWAVPMSVMIPDITPDIVTGIIRRKEGERIKIYRKSCDEIWLLVVIDGHTPSGSWEIPRETIETEFVTQFDRVVLFDFFNGIFKDLTVSAPNRVST
jgi:hypothetical protein